MEAERLRKLRCWWYGPGVRVFPRLRGSRSDRTRFPLSCDLFLGNGAAAVAARSGSTSNATNVDDNPLHKIWARGSYVLAVGYLTNRILPHFCH